LHISGRLYKEKGVGEHIIGAFFLYPSSSALFIYLFMLNLLLLLLLMLLLLSVLFVCLSLFVGLAPS